MKVFVCHICGEVYIGENIPGSCPFCGVNKKFLRLARSWHDANKGVELSDTSRENLKKALDLELSNTAFYDCAAKTLSDTAAAKMFKGLKKVEKEHAEVFQKLLGLEELPEAKEECENDAAKCIAQSLQREQRAVAFYEGAAKAAAEPRIKEVFEAIRDVEKDHILLDQEMAQKHEGAA